MSDSQTKADVPAAERVDVKTVTRAVETDKPTPAKAENIAEAVASSKTPVAKKTSKNAAQAKSPAARKARNKVAKPAATKPRTSKDGIMTKTNTTTTTDFTQTVQQATADVQSRLKTAFEKGTELTGDVAEFQKANVEALVASGKILASGMQDLSRVYIEEAKSAAETLTGDVKQMAAIKSPTELFQLQGEIARRNFEAAVAQASKNAEAMMKLANEVFAPLSSRASQAAEKFSKAA